MFNQRCIVPVTGFFEPHERNKKKYPVYIHRKDDTIFSLAGIYTVIGKIVTFSILTKAANPFFETIHNIKKRQPVILNLSTEKEWLQNGLTDIEIKEILQKEYDSNTLEAYTISKDLYRTQLDSNHPKITQQVTYDELGYTYL